MCGQTYSNDRLSELPISVIKKCVEETPTIEHIFLFGGEPFLYSDMKALLQFLNEKSIPVRTTTNGTLLEKNIENIFNYNIRDLVISFDSHLKNEYQKIRGEENYEKVLSNISLLLHERTKRNLVNPSISVNCVILPDNIENLIEYYDFMMTRFPELDNVRFQVPIMLTEQQGMLHEKIFHETFGCVAKSWNWFYHRIPSFSNEQIELLYNKLQLLLKCEKVIVQGSASYDGLKNAVGFSYIHKTHPCEYPFNALSVLPNGDMTFCADFPDYIFGNLYKESLNSAWNSEKAEMFRRYILENGGFPICARCCNRNQKFTKTL